MVFAGKIFRLRQGLKLPDIQGKLKGFKKEEPFDEEPLHIGLLTEIYDLTLEKNSLKGVYAQDTVTYIYHHGERTPTPTTLEIPFAFFQEERRVMLVVMEKKLLANNIANRLSEALFVTSGYITEANIPPDVLKSFHEQNPEDTKVTFFDNVDIPNVNKLSLYGSGLMNTALYNDYCSRGKIWYIVMTSRKYDMIVGITRNAVVTIFNNVDQADYLDYVVKEVFPLIE